MITFNLMGRYGRLGNQMFQYATLYSIAKTKKFSFGIPKKQKSNNPYQNLQLTDYFLNLTAEDSSEYQPIHAYREENFNYNTAIFGVADNTDICGYFQTEKYFYYFKDDLKKEFSFKDEIEEKSSIKRNEINDPVISLHMRLGDYKFLSAQHPICSLEYYQIAFDQLPKDLPVVVFSDEINVAKQILEPLNKKTTTYENHQPDEDLCLMTKCDYHVIANSSFSWWGAWLSNTKKVIAPSKWFGDVPNMPKNWDDIYCKEWIIL